VTNEQLKNDVTKLVEQASNYIRGDAISIATLKDEKRPIAKVDAGKTRVFEACPQHLVIALRQYILSFAAHLMENRIDNGMCVGINPYSLEWTKLAHRLLTKGNNLIAGDFANFDGCMLQQLVTMIGRRIALWTARQPDGTINWKIYATIITLWEHISNADVLVKDGVIRQTHSNPSGNPITVMINSLYHLLVMRIAYLLLKQEQGLPMICDYGKYVVDDVYGDDGLMSICKTILHWFNQHTITAALAKLGMTYTDETKTGTVASFRTLEDVSFLKRKFSLQMDGTYLAPMELTNILEITNWIRGKSLRSATVENCECAIMELSLHTEDVYNFWVDKIRTACHEKGLRVTTPTHWEWMQEYRYNRDRFAISPYSPLW
jgi:hypothetical protein